MDERDNGMTEGIEVRVPALYKPLIPEFLQGQHQLLTQLEAALQQENFDEIAELGHRMKGAGASYGFVRVSELGCELMAAAAAPDAANIRTLLDEYASYLTRLVVLYD